MKILVVDDEDSVRRYLTTALSRDGHDVVDAANGQGGLEVFEQERPDLVLSDIQMPGMDGLEMLGRIRRLDRQALVVMMTGYGSEEYAVKALRLRASNYLTKPVRLDDLLHQVKKYEAMIEARDIQERVPGLTLLHTLSVEFDNSVMLVPRRADYLVSQTEDAYDDETRTGLVLGLVELLVNSIEHGNLDINFEEKKTAIDAGFSVYEKLLQDRLSDPELERRRVRVDFEQNPSACAWTISDEGGGFDFREVLRKCANPEGTMLQGRGIFLCRFQFDELEYIGSGNTVRALKRISKQNQAEEA